MMQHPTASDTDVSNDSLRGHSSTADDRNYIVGIGASAHGLTALKAFVGALPDSTGLAFVIVQHLAPDHPSNLAKLLAEAGPLPVESADDGTRIEPGHVYVISPGDQLSIRDGILQTEQLPDLETERHTIDFLFRSLADDLGDHAIGILLSGAGTDGTAGLQLIKRHGGLTLAQDPAEAGVDSMPRHAIDAGVVDIVSRAADLPDRLVSTTTHGPDYRRLGSDTSPDDLPDDDLERLHTIMAMLRDRTGHDLSEYKRPTLLRRIGRRMQLHELESLDAYIDFLETHPDELDALLDEMLIKVTGFFRDPETWEYLADEIVPRLFDGKDRDDEVRVWVPGCATGEEAYTLGVLLRHHAERLDQPPDIKIFGTDIDQSSIRTAREGIYPSAIASDVPSAFLQRYFRIHDGDYRVAKTVRNQILFAEQNVLTDPPFSNLDLVSCRNLLIYLEPPAQTRLLRLLHYGLRLGGFLLLGTSDTTSTTSDLFEPIERTHNLYRSCADDDDEVVVPGSAFGYEQLIMPPPAAATPEGDTTEAVPLGPFHRETMLESHEIASVLIDEKQELVHTLGDVRPYLSIPAGEATNAIVDMVDERLRPVVRTAVFDALRRGETSTRRDVEPGDDAPPLIIQATPVDDPRDDGRLVELSFRPAANEPSPPPGRPATRPTTRCSNTTNTRSNGSAPNST